MTFIEEITPHIERIRLHKEGGRITSIEILREIAGIHFTHIRSNDFDIPTNLGCGSCVAHMINQLVGKIDREFKHIKIKSVEVDKSKLKGKITDTIVSPKKMTFPLQEPKEKLKEIGDKFEKELTGSSNAGIIRQLVENPKAMKWGAFKKYCTSKGLKVKGKKRVQLEEELNNL